MSIVMLFLCTEEKNACGTHNWRTIVYLYPFFHLQYVRGALCLQIRAGLVGNDRQGAPTVLQCFLSKWSVRISKQESLFKSILLDVIVQNVLFLNCTGIRSQTDSSLPSSLTLRYRK